MRRDQLPPLLYPVVCIDLMCRQSVCQILESPLEYAPMPIVQKSPKSKTQGQIDFLSWITDGKAEQLGLKLFDEASQLYELQLARMEFCSLGSDRELLRRRLAYFEEVAGEKTWHYHFAQVEGKGQIGHTNQYLTHWFYPYKGKFHGQMVKALLNFMGVDHSSTVLDPFVGSGTTLVECATIGVNSIGVDINPALCVVSQIKSDGLFIDYPAFEDFVRSAGREELYNYFHRKELGPAWHLTFSREGRDATELIEEAWEKRFPERKWKTPIEWRCLVMLVYLHALSDHTYLKGTNKERTLEEFFYRDLEEYSESLEGTHTVLNKLGVPTVKPRVVFGDALALPVEAETIDGIVTSPPYSIALDYVRNDRHLLDYLGINTEALRDRMVGLKGEGLERVASYDVDIKRSLTEMLRVLKPNCWAAIVLGDVVVDGTRTNFCDRIIGDASELGFSEAWSIRRAILGGFARLRYEYIVMLRK